MNRFPGEPTVLILQEVALDTELVSAEALQVEQALGGHICIEINRQPCFMSFTILACVIDPLMLNPSLSALTPYLNYMSSTCFSLLGLLGLRSI